VGVASAAGRRSRRRVAVVAVCLSLALVAITVSAVRENARVEAQRQRVEQERIAYAALHPVVLSADVSTWPTRGSRATDAGLLADVRARLGDSPHVLFAGNVAGADIVVALTGPGEAPLLHVLTGSPDTPVDAWREAGGALVVGVGAVPAVSAAVADEQGGLHLLAVTLTSGITVAYSPAPLLSDDATVSRRYLRLPLTDGIGTALVPARPDRLRIRVDGTGFESIVAPLTVARAAPAPDTEAAMRAPVTTTGSCQRSPQLGDVQNLVREATGDAGLAGTDVTGIRLLWCRQYGSRGEAAVALTAGHGPDIQCYESGETASDGLRTTSSQCWPVPRGTGATAPFLAPDLSSSSGPSGVLDLTVFAPGSTSADVRAGPLASPPLAAGPVAADGYVRFAVPLRARMSAEVFEREGIVVVRDGRGEANAILPARSRHLFDAWGEGSDGPLAQQ
jgi:hypothetical protein